MSAQAAAQIKNRFNDLSAEFHNTGADIVSHTSSVASACGEFSGSVADGNDMFEMSWRETFDACRTAAAVIAGNTNTFEVELDRLDQDYGHTPTL
ncbi:MAG TPA: hypothetical protein VFH10_13760 [Nocardioides sp.]|uniref:hypothetical protein n=1 Tax=Nocardioides sp. TaxID=35761 RepID=UPI002D7F8C26|nr:hypothetical protein [Nocardioides sp.]HET6653705.1 hypothetical protein [Nocardioides sp.]